MSVMRSLVELESHNKICPEAMYGTNQSSTLLSRDDGAQAIHLQRTFLLFEEVMRAYCCRARNVYKHFSKKSIDE